MHDDPRHYTYLIMLDVMPEAHGPPTPIWIGKGRGSRANDTFEELTTHKNRVLRAVARRALRQCRAVRTVIYQTFENEEDAFAGEVALIARFGRQFDGSGILCNVSPGGPGRRLPNSPQHRERASIALRATWQDADRRAANSAARKAEWRNPIVRQRRIKGLRAVMSREDVVTKIKSHYDTPEKRAAHTLKIRAGRFAAKWKIPVVYPEDMLL